MKTMLIFLVRLETAISCTVIREEAKRQVEKLLAYENTNQECQKAVDPICETCETGTIIDYLKACRNLGSETQKMQMQILAETMAVSFKRGNEGCFTCGDKNHLKTDCLKKANKNILKSAPTAIEEFIEPKNVNLNLILKGNIFWETKQGTHQVPFNRNQG